MLVEVKVDADFHSHEAAEGPTLQPDTYVREWERAAIASDCEARFRRVATLSRHPAVEIEPAERADDLAATRRGADLSWRAVRDLLARLVHEQSLGGLEPVAAAYVAGLDAHVLRVVAAELPEDPVLRAGVELLDVLAPELERRVVGARLVDRLLPRVDYVGRYVTIPRAGDVQIWVYVTTAAGRYNVGRSEANLWLAERPDGPTLSDPLRAAMKAAGFDIVTDLAGTSMRRRLGMSEIASFGVSGSDRANAVLDRIVRTLGNAGFETR